jgi:hypothetical protein
MRRSHHAAGWLFGVLLFVPGAGPLGAAEADDAPPPITVARLAGPVALDGDLSDPAWSTATRVEHFVEYYPADNAPPPVSTVAYLAYDDDALYVAVRADDPRPQEIRAPFVERDLVFGDQDNVALFLDPRGDRRVALQLRVSPRGVQADAVNNDATGSEDFAPDFFYDTAARIDGGGWSAELRIPLRSLRFDAGSGRAWGFFLVRNYPRAQRHQISSVRIPRGLACFVCRAAPLLIEVPARSGGGLVLAPYATLDDGARAGAPGEPLSGRAVGADAGLDVKWAPSGGTAVDLALNPDFSQIESDVAQIAVNSRFALFFPEKRPFFLEGVDLFETPLNAVYSRTITDPRWGARATGRAGSASYTLLAAQDEGGGLVVLPGATGSDYALQDFRSRAFVGRARREAHGSYASLFASAREIEGGGHNRVFGPDFRWQPGQRDHLTGQWLWSRSLTPRRPELAREWDGRRIAGQAGFLEWRHASPRLDWNAVFTDVGREFRADLGFVPQVGYRYLGGGLGTTFYREGRVLHRLRPFARWADVQQHAGGLLNRGGELGLDVFGARNLVAQAKLTHERLRSGGRLFDITQAEVYALLNPSRAVPRLYLRVVAGGDVDHVNTRPGRGAEVRLQARARPGGRLTLLVDGTFGWLNVARAEGGRARLFTAWVQRAETTWHFDARASLRLIGQYVDTRRDPALYRRPVPRRSADFGGSALFTYRLNWQTALYVGYGDERALDARSSLRPLARELFVKLSYALQR